jgi:hypothetical protein
MEQMERTDWTDERIDDAFSQLRDELHDMRSEMREGFRDRREEDRSIRGDIAQLKLFMLGGLITILATFIATNA